MMAATEQQWGTAAEVAVILGVSTGTVDRWMREKRVTFRKLGQRLSLADATRLADVGEDQYMREQAVGK
jgi:excisionase family DNA binding protein